MLNLHVVTPGSHGVSAVNFPWNIFAKAVQFHLQIFLVAMSMIKFSLLEVYLTFILLQEKIELWNNILDCLPFG